jgi:tRNA/rRNA methyltransferase
VVDPQPQCDIRSDKARALAVGSVEVLDNARIFPTLSDAIADLNRVMATTIRPRAMTQVIYTPEKAADIAIQSLGEEEVALADSIVTIATNKYFSSINLAQAVNIVCHELWKVNIAKNPHNPGVIGVDSSGQRPDTWLHPKDGERLAKREELDMFLKRVEAALSNTNYQRDENRREICFRSIRNVFQRTLMTKTEVDLMHGMLTGLLSEKDVHDARYMDNPLGTLGEEELISALEGRK